jgi:hypothetical protein
VNAQLSFDASTIQERFEQFHADNPHVYADLVMLARRAQRRGNSRIGIGMLFELVRWRRGYVSTGTGFLLNNNFRSRYARLISEQEPDLAGMFETRELRSA